MITAKMGGARAISVQPRFTSSFLGYLPSRSTQPHPQLFRYWPGCNRVSMQFSRPLSGLTNLLFNSRKLDDLPHSKRKCLKPGKVSPPRPVPKYIPKPPYVESKMMPGIASGPEVHDEQGIERMRASGRIAAQFLQFAGTLVKPGIITDEIDEAVHQMIIDNEPMLTIGSINPIMWNDDWTVVTEDGSLSAQFEHTILITSDGVEILTQC